MRKASVLLCLVTILGLLSWSAREVLADSAEVLPKGVKKVGLSSNFFLPIEKRYDESGDKEPLAADFNQVLDRNIFQEFALLEAALGMPSGSAILGTSVVDYEYHITEITLDFQYGLTDRLSAGISIPYRFFKNKVSTKVDTAGATMGINMAYGTAGDSFGVPIIPIAAGGVKDDSLATEFAQQTLEQNYGYDRIDDVSQNGVLDMSVGGRYQYFNSENWRLAVTGGVRIPTGKVDDPDNLADFGFGSGTWTPFLNLNQDYIGIKNLVLNATFRYSLVLPHEETLRVPESADQPITANKEKVDRNIGDSIELEFSGTYKLRPDLTASLLYRYGYWMKDNISGDLGYNYESLEEGTNCSEHIGIVGISYSTLSLFTEKKFPVPIEVGVFYRNRFAGKNEALASQYIGLNLGVYF